MTEKTFTTEGTEVHRGKLILLFFSSVYLCALCGEKVFPALISLCNLPITNYNLAMRLLLSAGEASGDTYGAQLITALRERAPEMEFLACAARPCVAPGVRR